MRIIITALVIFSFTSVHSQTIVGLPVSSHAADSTLKHRWFFTSYTGISTGVTFSRFGSSPFLIAPFSFQLNRALNNNIYAFANVTAAPAFTGISPFAMGMNKSYPYTPYRKFGTYSSASLGLMYLNDARTFSISGSVGVERSNPLIPFYTGSSFRQVPVIPSR